MWSTTDTLHGHSGRPTRDRRPGLGETGAEPAGKRLGAVSPVRPITGPGSRMRSQILRLRRFVAGFRDDRRGRLGGDGVPSDAIVSGETTFQLRQDPVLGDRDDG